ncbi:hypothetical protein L485_13845 [Sphingobium baderi LL03]|uniref:Uncharacterized protein n=1 Tax=Sphingobium baderi LL03 TaxID=1114964 RepID=T0GIX9_9SPHN|nr:hypothetical protein L485_13845 [Sphingobium baderi LL03]
MDDFLSNMPEISRPFMTGIRPLPPFMTTPLRHPGHGGQSGHAERPRMTR